MAPAAPPAHNAHRAGIPLPGPTAVVMNERPTPRLADLPHRARAWLACLPVRWRAWRAEFRWQPGALWGSPALRVTVVSLAGVCILLLAQWVVGRKYPAVADPFAQKPTRWAVLYVACTDPECRATGTTRQDISFAGWPLKCERCGKLTVYRARPCAECRQRYAVAPNGPQGCPFCAAAKTAKAAEGARPVTKSKSSDDEEDRW